MAPTLTETMDALQALGDAVTADNRDAYLTALARARKIGLTQEQINDAWEHRAVQRLRGDSGRSHVHFDHDGQVRT
jgi:hypothetical protein